MQQRAQNFSTRINLKVLDKDLISLSVKLAQMRYEQLFYYLGLRTAHEFYVRGFTSRRQKVLKVMDYNFRQTLPFVHFLLGNKDRPTYYT